MNVRELIKALRTVEGDAVVSVQLTTHDGQYTLKAEPHQILEHDKPSMLVINGQLAESIDIQVEPTQVNDGSHEGKPS